MAGFKVTTEGHIESSGRFSTDEENFPLLQAPFDGVASQQVQTFIPPDETENSPELCCCRCRKALSSASPLARIDR
jgi:hypothetical protein